MGKNDMQGQVRLPIICIDRHRLLTDGDGVTTLVCSYGCPLQCAYCLNPFSWAADTKYRYHTPNELLEAVRIDDLYFQATGGGITFGGGESLLHSAFIREFKNICPENWKLYAETSLNVPFRNVEQSLSAIDFYIIDIKDMNPNIYRRYTGMENDRVLHNLEFLLEKVGASRLRVRVPLIPSYNTKEDMEKSVQKLMDMGVNNIEPFSYVVG